MLDYKLLEALALVLREGGFEKAAQALHLTQSAVSQRVRLLEERVGKPLLVRGSPPRPTGAGKALLRHFRQVRLLEDDLARGLEPETDAFRTLPLAVNADSLAIWFLDALAPLARERRILLDLVVDDQERTHALLVQGEVAGCLSTRSEPLRGTRCTRLGVMPYLCCAAPEFAGRWFPDGLTEQDAARAPVVLFNRRDEVHDAFLRAELGHSQENPRGYPRHYIPSSEKFVDAVRAGLAYGMIPHPQAAPHLASGELVEPEPGRFLAVELFWHRWDLESGLMDAVQDALRRGAESVLG
ncbi:LysR family transcriptional regulator ArgP [Paucidesulfovibrio longus]|uniref:LysR family transcriptional regulator ArgP n=1 Tax=Paucidesulfovibrio longus TaxID=889 RepID=UPI0003B3A003|nr:LysR family transcriptional regulator ArgP [Paucidesulfovibrio longus]